ncbi:MAG: hypothetical protein H6708_12870 [Kofleriaceae bacterium]|nr:hypothetical protein [Myxococcales bacterium]MCB9561292.1 hypothetical protein [Kofleriaceae bacterium]
MALLIHDQRLTRRVGAAVLAVTVLVVVFVVTVLDRMETDGVHVRVYFTQATAFSEGAPVQIAGQTIGKLTSIAMVPANQCGPGHPLEGTGGLVAVATIDPAWARRIPANAEFFIGARSVFAPRYLEIGAPPRHALPDRPIREGDQVRGVDPPNLDRLLQRTWDNLTELKTFVDTIRPWTVDITVSAQALGATVLSLEPSPGAFDAIDAEVQGAASDARRIVMDALEGTFDPAAFRRLAARVRVVVGSLEDTSDQIGARLTLLRYALRRAGDQLPKDVRATLDRALAAGQAAMKEAGRVLGEMRGMMDDASWGKGTIGALAGDLELIDDFKEVVKVLKRHPWRVVAPPQSGD